MPLILGFHTKYILNPSGMYFNPAEVMLMAFAILFKIPSAHCDMVTDSSSLEVLYIIVLGVVVIVTHFNFCKREEKKHLGHFETSVAVP